MTWATSVNRQPEADALVRDTPLPDGWHIEVREARRYRFRSLWAVYLFHLDVIDWNTAVYDLPGALHVARARAERVGRAQVITADLDGWVKEWSDG